MTRRLVEQVSLAIGVVLLLGASSYVWQVFRVVQAVAARSEAAMRSAPGGLEFELRSLDMHDVFYISTESFFLLHVWIAWAGWWLIRGRASGRVSRGLLGAASIAAIVLAVGYSEHLWLAKRGTTVGLL